MQRAWVTAGTGVLFFVFGGAIAWSLLATAPPPPVTVEVFLLGTRIDTARPVRPQVAALTRHYLAGKVKLMDGGEVAAEVSPRDLGVTADLDRIERTVASIVENRGDVARYLARHRGAAGGRIDLPLPVRVADKRFESLLLSLKFSFDRAPQDARLDMETRRVVAHTAGRSLLLDDTIAAVEMGLAQGRAEVPLAVSRSEPERTGDDIKDVDIGAVLGLFETPYCLTKKCWDRNHNLQLGGKLLDGTIVRPGETFDFNQALGPRSEARGFRPAPTIEQGVLTLTPGGGTCQTASTLYAAAFFAGMEPVQRRPHSRPSGYILLGLDATVTYPNINMAFRNPFDFPVVIHYKVENGVMRCEILGKERARVVHFVRYITKRTPFAEQVIEEPSWPKGVSVVTQNGIEGFRVKRYRVVWEGSHVERELTETVYPPTAKTIHVGTDPSASAQGFVPPLEPDAHPPYQADTRIRYYLGEKNDFK